MHICIWIYLRGIIVATLKISDFPSTVFNATFIHFENISILCSFEQTFSGLPSGFQHCEEEKVEH